MVNLSVAILAKTIAAKLPLSPRPATRGPRIAKRARLPAWSAAHAAGISGHAHAAKQLLSARLAATRHRSRHDHLQSFFAKQAEHSLRTAKPCQKKTRKATRPPRSSRAQKLPPLPRMVSLMLQEVQAQAPGSKLQALRSTCFCACNIYVFTPAVRIGMCKL